MRMGSSMAWICPHYNRLRMTESFTVPRRAPGSHREAGLTPGDGGIAALRLAVRERSIVIVCRGRGCPPAISGLTGTSAPAADPQRRHAD